jgi:hypothetical protein
MALTRLALAISAAVVLTGCGDELPTAPSTSTAPRLTAVVAPNPMTAPAVGAELVWNLELRGGTTAGSALLDRGEGRLVDASGATVGQMTEFWSRSTGCAQCSDDIKVLANTSQTFNGHRITYVGGGAPVNFTYTLAFMDDQGPGLITVEVPVR